MWRWGRAPQARAWEGRALRWNCVCWLPEREAGAQAGVSKAGGTRGQITSLGFVGQLRKGGLPTSESHWEVESRRVKASAS